MKAIIFENFGKVWTPRTPDSGYDSLGPGVQPPIVVAPILNEGLGSGISASGSYLQGSLYTSSFEGTGSSIALHSGTYSPP